MNEALSNFYSVQYYSHIYNTVLENTVFYSFVKTHLPAMISWYAVSPITREAYCMAMKFFEIEVTEQ